MRFLLQTPSGVGQSLLDVLEGELGIIPEKVFRALPMGQAPEKGGHGDARELGYTPILKPKPGVDGVHVAEVVAGVKEGGQGLPLQGVFRVPFQ